MKIEAGKFYRTRDGEIVGPMEPNASDWFPLKAVYKGDTISWSANGTFTIDGAISIRDLIEEVPDPRQPAPHEAEERFEWGKVLDNPIGLTEAIRSADIRNGIDATLAERGTRYGEFAEHARITQAIKAAMENSPNWMTLTPDQREALEMIAHKAGRILNGDPDYHDSWHDIVGYAKLVADRLQA